MTDKPIMRMSSLPTANSCALRWAAGAKDEITKLARVCCRRAAYQGQKAREE